MLTAVGPHSWDGTESCDTVDKQNVTTRVTRCFLDLMLLRPKLKHDLRRKGGREVIVVHTCLQLIRAQVLDKPSLGGRATRAAEEVIRQAGLRSED